MFISFVSFCLIFIIVTIVIIIILAVMKDIEKNRINIKFIPNNNLIYNASTGKLIKSYIPSEYIQKNVLIDKVLFLKDLYISLIILVCKYNYNISKDIIEIINSSQNKYKSYLYEIDLEDKNLSIAYKYEIVMYRSIHILLKQKFANFSEETFNLSKIKSFLIKDMSSFIIKQDTVKDIINSIRYISQIMFYFYIIKYYTKITINTDMLDKICRFIRQNIYNTWLGFIDDDIDVLQLIVLHNLIVPNKDYVLSKKIFNSYNTDYINVPLKYELIFGNNTNDGIYFNKYINSLRYSFNNILIYCIYTNDNNELKTCIDFNNMSSYLAKKIYNNNKFFSDEISFQNDQEKMNIGSFVYEYNNNVFFIGCCLETKSYLITVINKSGIIVIRDYNLKNDFTYDLYVEYIFNKIDNYPCFIKTKNTIEEHFEKKSIFDIKKTSLLPIITKNNTKLFESFIGFNNKQKIDYLYDNENKIFIIDDISFNLNPNLTSISNVVPNNAKLVKISLKDKDLYYDVSILENNKLVLIDNYKSNIDKHGCNFITYPK